MHLQNIAKRINNKRKNKEFFEALQIYKVEIHPYYNSEIINQHTWLIANIMHCLRKTGKSGSSVDFFVKYLGNNLFNELPDHLIRELGWSLYYALSETGKSEYYNYTNDFLAVLSIEKEYLLLTKLLFLYCDEYSKKENPEWDRALLAIERYLPDQFSNETSTISLKKSGNNKTIETASDRERFYIFYTKALFNSKMFEECIAVCMEALERIKKFHYGNNLWLVRRLSLCYTNTGNLDKAIEGFEAIIKSKSDWYIQFELATMYFTKNNYEDALILACMAALNGGFTEYKVNMFAMLGKFFAIKESSELPCSHFNLSRIIRIEKGWKIPTELEDLINAHKCSSIHFPALDQYNQLAFIWKKYASRNIGLDKFLETYGTVTAILHEGSNGDGFITSTNGKSIYFRFPVLGGNIDLLKNGTNVYVKYKEREYKGKQVWNAVKVKIIN